MDDPDDPERASDEGGATADDADRDEGAVAPDEADVALEDVFDDLFATVEQRKAELPDGSYTASLLDHEKGEDAVLEKLGEESTELILAAKNDERDRVAAESADLVYHLFVLLAAEDLTLDDLRAELAARFG